MRLNEYQWNEICQAVQLDDQKGFERKVQELCRIFVAHERSHATRCDRVRARETGRVPFAVWER